MAKNVNLHGAIAVKAHRQPVIRRLAFKWKQAKDMRKENGRSGDIG